MAVFTFSRFGAGEEGRREVFGWRSLGSLRGLERNTLRVAWRLRSPDGKGQQRKECRLRGQKRVRGWQGGGRTPNWGWSEVRSAVFLPLERAHRAKGCLEGSVTRPGPQPTEASESLPTAVARRTSSTSCFRGLAASQEPLLYHLVVRGLDGRDARRSGDESFCGARSYEQPRASGTAGARLFWVLPSRSRPEWVPESQVPADPSRWELGLRPRCLPCTSYVDGLEGLWFVAARLCET